MNACMVILECFLSGMMAEHIHCFLYTQFFIWAGLR